jgi:hypothetical protein
MKIIFDLTIMQGFEPGSFGLEYFYLENFRKISGNILEIFKKDFFPEIIATLQRMQHCIM